MVGVWGLNGWFLVGGLDGWMDVWLSTPSRTRLSDRQPFISWQTLSKYAAVSVCRALQIAVSLPHHRSHPPEKPPIHPSIHPSIHLCIHPSIQVVAPASLSNCQLSDSISCVDSKRKPLAKPKPKPKPQPKTNPKPEVQIQNFAHLPQFAR